MSCLSLVLNFSIRNSRKQSVYSRIAVSILDRDMIASLGANATSVRIFSRYHIQNGTTLNVSFASLGSGIDVQFSKHKFRIFHPISFFCNASLHYNMERDGVSNHQPHDCLLNRLFRRRSKKTSKLCVTGLCAGNSPLTGEFPAQRVSNAENVSIWWRHHVFMC